MQTTPIHMLRDLVGIDSNSHNSKGVNQVQSYLDQYLEGLGMSSMRIPHPQEVFGELLVARLDQTADVTVSLLGHADTVRENEPSYHFHWDKQTNVIKGPGVADDKGGLTVALHGLNRFLSQVKKPSFNLQFISSPCEELGSPGFTQRLKELGQDSQVCLGFEPALDTGNIITSRHGNRWYDIEVKGREAHSGRASGEEINAAHEISMKISELVKLKQKHPECKLNIGAIRSHRNNYNIVCGKIGAKLDIRFLTEEACAALHQDIVKVVETPHVFDKNGRPAVASFVIADDCPSFEGTEHSAPFAETYLDLARELEGQACEHQHATGSSDLNHMSHSQCVAIDGLGPVGGKLHTKQEFVRVDSLDSRSEALARFLNHINDNVDRFSVN